MTPADRRITELIDKWLTSIDLHLSYAELSDGAYARAQSWPKHDRPTRWVLEVARQKIVELKTHCENRQAMGDATFAESLELMAFLANLVGIQHIQRFIPLADGPREDKSNSTGTVEVPTVIRPAMRGPASSEDATRQMPKLKTPPFPPPAAPPPAPPAVPVRKEAAKPAPAKRAPQPVAPAEPAADEPPSAADIKAKIIADAIRLLKWGKPWHELAELIGRIADRPPVAEIRKVLRSHKADIETKAAKKT